jgi:hypothetical protein
VTWVLRERPEVPPLAAALQTGAVLLIDVANVVGSRPTGWWRDRAGATRAFVDQIRAAIAAGRIVQQVTLVLEGKARQGVPAGIADGVAVLHARGSGDETLLDAVAGAADQVVTLVTADRELRRRAEALGADVVGPGWLLALLE